MFQAMEEDNSIRRFFIHKYVIFYKVKNNIIEFERILPSKSNYNQKEINQIKFPKKIKINK